MFKHLLIPLDGSALAEAVLPPAAELARRAGARVTLLHVIEHDAPAAIHGQSHLRSATEAEAYLKMVAERELAGIDVTRHVHAREVRDVAHSVVDHADEFEPDLVVMGSHGEGHLRDWFSGNIAQQVVFQGIIPVLLLETEPLQDFRFPFRRILVPLDGEPAHEQGLPAAAGMAQLCDAPVQLLTVVPTIQALSGSLAVTGSMLPETTRAVLDLSESGAAEYLARHVEALTGRGIHATARVMRGDPIESIEQTALEGGADLVALGTHGKAGARAFWAGSIAQKLLHRMRVSFLLAPAPEGAPAAAPASQP